MSGAQTRRTCLSLFSVFLAIAALLASSLAFGEAGKKLYRWKDAQGRTHISDVPPSDSDETVKQMKAPTRNSLQPFVVVPSPKLEEQRSARQQLQPDLAEDEEGEATEEEGKEQFTVDARRKACEEKKQAFAKAKACFDACGKYFYNQQTGRTGRNNSACGHCTEATEPTC